MQTEEVEDIVTSTGLTVPGTLYATMTDSGEVIELRHAAQGGCDVWQGSHVTTGAIELCGDECGWQMTGTEFAEPVKLVTIHETMPMLSGTAALKTGEQLAMTVTP